VVACLESWIGRLKDEINRFGIKKVKWIVSGGETSQQSIYNALMKIKEKINLEDEDIILLHDGVRPLIDDQIITDNINSVKKYGSAVTASYQFETVTTVNNEGFVENIIDRNEVKVAKAPQSFFAKDIIKAHIQAKNDNNMSFLDSASLMSSYGHHLHTVIGSPDNIKVTTAADFYMFRALLDARENSQIFG
jgi:2-C-methyl-D-erythritol 4-phosphate cytidylyltransferase